MIYLFSTKWATDQFIEGFAKTRDHILFKPEERTGQNE